MKIYNARYLDNNQRFLVAIITGFIAAILFGSLYGLITSFIHVSFSAMFVAVGYGVSSVIKYFGKGVHTRFMVVGAIMTTFAIFLGDMMSVYSVPRFASLLLSGNFSFVGVFFVAWLRSMASADVSGILSLAFRLIGIYIGYTQSVIL